MNLRTRQEYETHEQNAKDKTLLGAAPFNTETWDKHMGCFNGHEILPQLEDVDAKDKAKS